MKEGGICQAHQSQPQGDGIYFWNKDFHKTNRKFFSPRRKDAKKGA